MNRHPGRATPHQEGGGRNHWKNPTNDVCVSADGSASTATRRIGEIMAGLFLIDFVSYQIQIIFHILIFQKHGLNC